MKLKLLVNFLTVSFLCFQGFVIATELPSVEGTILVKPDYLHMNFEACAIAKTFSSVLSRMNEKNSDRMLVVERLTQQAQPTHESLSQLLHELALDFEKIHELLNNMGNGNEILNEWMAHSVLGDSCSRLKLISKHLNWPALNNPQLPWFYKRDFYASFEINERLLAFIANIVGYEFTLEIDNRCFEYPVKNECSSDFVAEAQFDLEIHELWQALPDKFFREIRQILALNYWFYLNQNDPLVIGAKQRSIQQGYMPCFIVVPQIPQTIAVEEPQPQQEAIAQEDPVPAVNENATDLSPEPVFTYAKDVIIKKTPKNPKSGWCTVQ